MVVPMVMYSVLLILIIAQPTTSQEPSNTTLNLSATPTSPLAQQNIASYGIYSATSSTPTPAFSSLATHLNSETIISSTNASRKSLEETLIVESTVSLVNPNSTMSVTAFPSVTTPASIPEFCPSGCKCSINCSELGADRSLWKFTCRIKSLMEFMQMMDDNTKSKVCYLDLAHSDISSLWVNVFDGFDELRVLYLDHNNLTYLGPGMFLGLPSLRHLSVRYSNLKKWDGFLFRDIPRLQSIDFSGNPRFTAKIKLLRNTTVQSVTGLSYNKQCRECNMTRSNITFDRLLNKASYCEYLPQEYWYIAEDMYSKFILLKGECRGGIKCEYELTSTSKLFSVFANRCWDMITKLRPVVWIFGVIAIALNIVVVAAVLALKPLRRLTPFLLIAHMAFCDVMIGVYAVAIADGHQFITVSPKHFRLWRRSFCPYYRTLFFLGQIMEVSTSFLVTSERYLAIVFCMNPDIRITKTKAVISLTFAWIFAAAMCTLLDILDGPVISDNYMCILIRDLEARDTKIFISHILMIILVIFYMIIFAMYIHIYIYVRRSSRNAGVRQRETQLAARIGIMVFTSFLFFVVPNVITITVTLGTVYFPLDIVSNTIVRKWFPPMCLVFNASLNPLLFAYRNDKFVKTLKLCGAQVMKGELPSFPVHSHGPTVHVAPNLRTQSHLNLNTAMEMTARTSITPSDTAHSDGEPHLNPAFEKEEKLSVKNTNCEMD